MASSSISAIKKLQNGRFETAESDVSSSFSTELLVLMLLSTQHEPNAVTLDNQLNSLPATWQDHDRLLPIPEELQKQNPISEDLPDADQRIICTLRDLVTRIRLLMGESNRSVAAMGFSPAVAPSEVIDVEDLADAPSAFEEANFEPLYENFCTYYDLPNTKPIESCEDPYDAPLYHPNGGMVDSIFDLVSLDPVATPYSWLMENPGKIPAAIHPVSEEVYNLAGEKEVECAIKSFVKGPKEYFLTSTSVKCLVRLRHKRL